MQFEGHEFEMAGETLTVDGKSHWNRCFGCGFPCATIMGNEGMSGLSQCCSRSVAYLRFGHVLPSGITLPREMQKIGSGS